MLQSSWTRHDGKPIIYYIMWNTITQYTEITNHFIAQYQNFSGVEKRRNDVSTTNSVIFPQTDTEDDDALLNYFSHPLPNLWLTVSCRKIYVCGKLFCISNDICPTTCIPEEIRLTKTTNGEKEGERKNYLMLKYGDGEKTL